ncbi:MAG: PEP-utilizing enzyme [Deltaproteobacteria bacterium]|nr:PEP-utilizing enzyme [Deltaproteobacteria bacterium]
MHLPPNPFYRAAKDEPSSFAASFRLFRRLLFLNNAVLEKIGRMEGALAGEYVFDRKFLSEAVGALNELVREVVSCLGSLTSNRYLDLYDRYEEIAGKLSGLALEYAGPYDRNFTLAYDLIDSDFEELVGAKNATLSEIRNRLHLRTPDGFAITAAAYREFMEANTLFVAIDAICAGPGSSRDRAEGISRLLDQARFPEQLVTAVQDELAQLLKRAGGPVPLAVRSSGVGEDAETRSFAGQFHSVLEVRPELSSVLDAYRQVIGSRFSVAALEYLGPKASSREIPMAAGVQPMIQSRVAGVTYSRDPESPEKNQLLITSLRGAAHDLVSGRRQADRFVMSRAWPFTPLTSEIVVPDSFPSTREPFDQLPSGLRRGSATLMPKELAKLAEQALLLEKTFGEPQDIEWALGDEPVILQSRPLSLPAKPPPLPGELAAELAAAIPLMSGKGQVANLGIAAGRVVHVDQNTDSEQFPVGAIAVARFPSPQLSPIVWRAAAMITEIGGPTGHLATIAREYRTPALFGTGDALRLLADGAEVTVDVENKQVYQGIIEGLVQLQVSEEDDYRSSQELRILRRILRWVAPITLADPTSAGFKAENCSTFHDILRFAHEKAIDALIHFHADQSGSQEELSRSVRLPIPLKLRVIDLGAGIRPEAPQKGEISMEMLNSRPLNAILQGFLKDDQGGKEPASLGFRDILSGISKPLALLTGPAYPGDNLGIIAEHYCNLCLRLGYHLNVVDAYMSPDPDNNYIYFRFAGGMAEKAKREWRARLISAILSGLYFKVERTGDLVIAKARNLDIPRMERVLGRLGELISFTRQLDVRMRDEAAIEEFFQRFLVSIKQEQAGVDG